MNVGDQWKDKVILSRTGKTEGVATGAVHRCQLEGCMGWRVTVRWPVKTGNRPHFTHPCSRGLSFVKPGVFQIM